MPTPTPPPLFAHQAKAERLSLERESFALFLDMGLGKSRVAIDTAAQLDAAGKIDAAIVLAPKGVVRNWSALEIPKHWSGEAPRIALWSAGAGKRATRELVDALSATGFVWLCINVEALATEKGRAYLERFLRARRALVVVDEATTIKGPKAARTKALLSLRHLAPYRRILTGTPITKSPLDLYAPCLFLGAELLGVSSWYAMRGRYCVLGTVDRFVGWDPVKQERKVQKIRTVVGYKNLEDLQERLARFSFRATKEECLDLPPKVYLRREVELEPRQATLYAQMRLEARALLESGAEIKAPLVIAQILRLHQIACGFLPRPEGGVERISSARVEALLEALEETSGKVIVWASYTADVHAIAEALREAYGAGSTVIYAGETPEAERPKIVAAFQREDGGPRFFVGQPRTGGYGLTLTAASTVVYYSNTFDLEVRLQSEDRAHRIGQTRSVSYLDLVTPGTVDEKILDALRAKRSLAGAVLGETWQEWI